MIICVCKRVNSAQIREAVRNGATDVLDLSARLGLGTCCGTCIEYASQLIDEEARTLPYNADIA